MPWKCHLFRNYPADHRMPLSLEGIWAGSGQDLGSVSRALHAAGAAAAFLLLQLPFCGCCSSGAVLPLLTRTSEAPKAQGARVVVPGFTVQHL